MSLIRTRPYIRNESANFLVNMRTSKNYFDFFFPANLITIKQEDHLPPTETKPESIKSEVVKQATVTKELVHCC